MKPSQDLALLEDQLGTGHDESSDDSEFMVGDDDRDEDDPDSDDDGSESDDSASSDSEGDGDNEEEDEVINREKLDFFFK